jgi:hypothetical protein
MRTLRRAGGAVAVVVLTAGLAACSCGHSGGSASGTKSPQAALAALATAQAAASNTP